MQVYISIIKQCFFAVTFINDDFVSFVPTHHLAIENDLIHMGHEERGEVGGQGPIWTTAPKIASKVKAISGEHKFFS